MDAFAGKTLSRYRVLQRIGAGGMGVVYLCRDERLERDVALKALPPGALSDDQARKRFRREALALSKLNHPNIATVHDFDTEDGVDFLVMEYVAGQTLDEKLQSGPLPEDEIVRLGCELAAGLAAAHAQGIVHRDLKPGNVRLTEDGRLKVLDFGLARLVQRKSSDSETTRATVTTTDAGGVAGTLPYMAPEQLRGEPVDIRTDLWGAGLLLYEMAAGRRPFPHRDSGPLVAAILQEAPPPVSRFNPAISAGLQSIISHCIEKNPSDRYKSADELARDLRRLAVGSPVAVGQPRRGNRRRAAVLIAGVAILAAAGALVLTLRGGQDRFGPGLGTPIRSLAVLPLTDLSGDHGDDYFADGMTDQLITTLAQIGALRVISRTSVMTFKNVKETLPQIGRALHVDAVLEGSVLRSGDRVRITAQLVRAPTDEHLWAQTYERDLRDVLSLQNEVARSIAQEIRIAVSPRERLTLERSRPVNVEAHIAYLKGLYNWNKRTVPSIHKAVDYFRQSIANDPDYALPYAGLATCYAVLPAYDREHAREANHDCRVAARKAMELDSTLAEPHAVMAGLLSESDYDQRGAEREFRRALELNPNYAPAHQWYADFLRCMGRQTEALAEVKRAQALDPLSLIISTEVGSILTSSNQYGLAIESLRNTIEMDPSFSRAHETLGVVYGFAGKYIESTWELQTQDSLLGTKTPAQAEAWYGPLRKAFRESGEKGFYRQLLKQRLALAKKEYVPPIKFAICYSRLGEKDSAFVWLDRAVEAQDPYVLRIPVEPHWDNLRSDPRYAALMKRLGLPIPR